MAMDVVMTILTRSVNAIFCQFHDFSIFMMDVLNSNIQILKPVIMHQYIFNFAPFWFKKNSVGSELMVVLGSSEMQVWSCPDSVGLETKMLLSGLCSDAREEHLSSGPTVRFLQQLKK